MAKYEIKTLRTYYADATYIVEAEDEEKAWYLIQDRPIEELVQDGIHETSVSGLRGGGQSCMEIEVLKEKEEGK